MFRTAELGRTVTKKAYKQRVEVLREEILITQQEMRQCAKFPVIIYFAGVDGAGKGTNVNRLNEWMDPRWIITNAYGEPADIERERPRFWRYWRDIPAKGTIGLFLSGWYHNPVLDHVYGRTSQAEFDDSLDRILFFENALAADGALILKFWMHLSKAAQKRRLKSLENDPLSNWQVKEEDWQHWSMYDQFIAAAERIIMKTSTGHAPWTIVEGADFKYSTLTVAEIVRNAMEKRLEAIRREKKIHAVERGEPSSRKKNKRNGSSAPSESAGQGDAGTEPEPLITVLSRLNMSKALAKVDYEKKILKYQARLGQLNRQAVEKNISTIMVMEGVDAAGKGGAIRRLIAALDARHYQVLQFAAPTDEERAHHYLWRFWRHLSRAGRMTIFDRSWYGRVLVERVEGFASEHEWRRAYAEINDFEEQLIEHGILLLKYWIHITSDEQLARFKSREETPYKRWKLTDEDWRNREKWNDYELAVNDMVQHTSTHIAPWVLVEGNDKRYARVKVIKTLCGKLEEHLDSGAAA